MLKLIRWDSVRYSFFIPLAFFALSWLAGYDTYKFWEWERGLHLALGITTILVVMFGLYTVTGKR